MKIAELREKNVSDLVKELKECKMELFKLRFQLHTKKLEKTTSINELKKTIARIYTVITEKSKAEEK